MQLKTKPKKEVKIFAITGTFHGSIVIAYCEGEARKIFHRIYNGESIIHSKRKFWHWENLDELGIVPVPVE